MALTVWYVSKYVTPPSHGSAGARGYLLMKALAQLGHQAVIITSDSNQLATPPRLGTAYLRRKHTGPMLCVGGGTGLAPFLSIVRDPETYERFEQVIVVHGVRQVNELAYRELLSHDLPKDEFLGEMVQQKLLYYPTVTREPFVHQGRIPQLLGDGVIAKDLGIPLLNPAEDRVMICGSPEMLRDLKALCEKRGFAEGNTTRPGQFVIERAFADS